MISSLISHHVHFLHNHLESFLEGNTVWDFRINVFKVSVLLVDMTSSLISIFLKAFRTSSDNEREAIGAVAVFVTFGVIALIAMMIISAILTVKIKNNQRYYIVSDFIVIFATLLYYVGDNLHPVLETYGEELSCDETCVEDAQTAGRCLLFAALILFRVSPKLLRKWLQVNQVDVVEIEATKKPNLFSAAFIVHILALLIDYDAIFSSVWGDFFTPNGMCTPSQLRGSWACWAISFLIGVVFVILYFYLENGRLSNAFCDCKPSPNTCLMLVALVIICFLPGMYLLGDNDEPIGCVCNGFNTTTGCSEITGYQVRFGMMGGTIALTVAAVTIAILFFILNQYADIQ